MVVVNLGRTMQNQRVSTVRFWLEAGPVLARLDERHLRQSEFADGLGLSRSTWSELVNGHRPLSPRVRRALLASPVLAGMAEHELWRRIGDGDPHE
jgi:hypothetical protein